MANIKKSPIIVTENAQNQLLLMMENAPENAIGIKLGLKNAGCAGMAYTMDYAMETDSQGEIIECEGIKIIIEAKSLLFLFGMVMDYEVTKLKSGFVFNNPNQTDACGCGESVKLMPASSIEPTPLSQ